MANHEAFYYDISLRIKLKHEALAFQLKNGIIALFAETIGT